MYVLVVKMCVYFHILSQYIVYKGVCLFTYTFIHPIALPSSSLQNVSAIPLNSTSFMITWSVSDPYYNYTVIWTNLNTGVMNNYTIQDNENSHIVTGLSDDANYAVSVAAANMCGSKNSDPITVYGKYLKALI